MQQSRRLGIAIMGEFERRAHRDAKMVILGNRQPGQAAEGFDQRRIETRVARRHAPAAGTGIDRRAASAETGENHLARGGIEPRQHPIGEAQFPRQPGLGGQAFAKPFPEYQPSEAGHHRGVGGEPGIGGQVLAEKADDGAPGASAAEHQVL